LLRAHKLWLILSKHRIVFKNLFGFQGAFRKKQASRARLGCGAHLAAPL